MSTVPAVPITSTPAAAAGRDIYEAWLAGRTESTLRSYAGDLRIYAAWIGRPDPAQAVEELLAAGPATANRIAHTWRASMLHAGLSPSTVNRRLSALRSVVELAARLGVVDWALRVEGVKSRSYRDTRGPGVDAVRTIDEHLAALAAGGDQKALRDRAMLRLLFDRGLRRGEVVALNVADYDPVRPAVRVIGKGHRDAEWLTISRGAADAVDAWLDLCGRFYALKPDQPLLLSFDKARKGSGRLTGRSVGRIVSAVAEAAGVGPVRPHGLRHSAITEVLNLSGGDVRSARQFSRHADLRTLALYDDARVDVGGELAERLGATL